MTGKTTILTIVLTASFSYLSLASGNPSDTIYYTSLHRGDTTTPLSYEHLYRQLKLGGELKNFRDKKLSFNKQVTTLLQQNSIYNSGRGLYALPGKLVENINSSVHSPVYLQSGTVDNYFISDTSYINNGGTNYQNYLDINSVWSIAGIPVEVNLQSNYSTDILGAGQYSTAIRFDKDSYLRQLKQKMTGKVNPAELLNSLEDPLLEFKQNASLALNNEIKAINDKYDNVLDAGKISFDNASFSPNGINELRKKITPGKENSERLREAERMVAAMRQKQNLSGEINSELLDSMNLILKQSGAEKELLAKVREHKKRWDSSGIFQKMNELESVKATKVNDMLNNPSFIRSNAGQMLSLNGLQKLFLNVNRLNIGRDVISLSPMSLQHFMHTGVSTEFINKASKTLMLVAGKQKDFNSIQDLSFNESLFSNAGNIRAGRIGLGGGAKSQSQISVSSFNQTMGNGMNIQALAMQEFRRVLVTTVSQQFNVGQNGTVNIDLSKSAVSYNGDMARTDSSAASKGNLSRMFSADDFWSNTAIYVKYVGEDNDKGLSYQFNFNKTANGYSNPGNGFLNGGSAEWGTRLRKQLLKKKMQIGLRANLRDYKFGLDNSARWRNVYVVLDARMKLKKGNSVTFRYQPNRMLKKEDGKNELVNLMDRLSLESNINRRFRKLRYNNYLTLAYQKNIFSMSADERVSNTSLQLNALQNFVIGKESFFANVNYNYSDNKSGYVYFNSSANIDAGYNYMLMKKIAASSGLVFASVRDWYSQFGARQTLSGQLNEKILIHFYIDVRRNTRVLETMWSRPVRGELTFSYKIR